MKALWKVQARRIDALTLRERAIMFVSIALALGALADSLVISPILSERRQLAAQIRKHTTELGALRGQVAASKALPLPDTPRGRMLAAIEEVRTERTALDARLRSLLAGRDEIARLTDVLDRVLRRHDRLTLTRLSTVPDTTTAAPPAGGVPAIRWQGVDLSVSGRYLDLMAYLADLEHVMPGLRWGELKIATKTMPPELTVRLMMAGEAP
jgi:MSHA biogenesis protein MshJ